MEPWGTRRARPVVPFGKLAVEVAANAARTPDICVSTENTRLLGCRHLCEGHSLCLGALGAPEAADDGASLKLTASK